MPPLYSCEQAFEQEAPISPNVPILLVAAAALIDPDGRVLLCQRPEGKSMAGLWEYPGGKVEKGESPEYALMRELSEELGIETRPSCYTPFSFASHLYDDFHLLMPLYLLRYWKNPPRGREGQMIKWVRPMQLLDYPMPPADQPLTVQLLEYL